MREAELWRRLEQHLGPSYARSWAGHVVFDDLGSRTVTEALAVGLPCKRIWEAACELLDLPTSER